MRTQGTSVQQEKNGKWSVSFETFKGTPGNERCISMITSGAVFESEDEAFAGQIRALDVLEETERFPDMAKFF